MFVRSLLLLTFITSSLCANAEEAKKPKLFSFMEYTELHLDRDDAGDLRIFKDLNLLNVSFRPNEKFTFSASAEFNYTNSIKASDYPNNWRRSLYTIMVNKILNEKDSFLNLDLGLAYRQNNLVDFPSSSYGNFRIVGKLSKKFNDKVSANMDAIYFYNNRRSVIPAKTWNNAVELTPSIDIQLTDKLTYNISDDFNFFHTGLNSSLIDHRVFITNEFSFLNLTYKVNDFVSPRFALVYDTTDRGGHNFSDSGYRNEEKVRSELALIVNLEKIHSNIEFMMRNTLHQNFCGTLIDKAIWKPYFQTTWTIML